MTISFTDEFQVDKKAFSGTEALDIFLNLDTRYFIDPALLVSANVPEFSNAEYIVSEYFKDLKALILSCEREGDMFWRKADKMLAFKEYTNTCLGYSNKGTAGSAIGPKIRKSLLKNLKSILASGAEDIRIFELIGIFQEDVGADRISDLIVFILLDNILAYTDRVTRNLKVQNIFKYERNGKTYSLPFNKYNEKAVFLLPKSILTALPIAYAFCDISRVVFENEQIRASMNDLVDLGNKRGISKEHLLALIGRFPDLKQELIKLYLAYDPQQYNFEKDMQGDHFWYEFSKEIYDKYPLELKSKEKLENKTIQRFSRE